MEICHCGLLLIPQTAAVIAAGPGNTKDVFKLQSCGREGENEMQEHLHFPTAASAAVPVSAEERNDFCFSEG